MTTVTLLKVKHASFRRPKEVAQRRIGKDDRIDLRILAVLDEPEAVYQSYGNAAATAVGLATLTPASITQLTVAEHNPLPLYDEA